MTNPNYNQMNNKKKISSIILVLLILASLAILYSNTGFLQKNKIDNRDLDKWEYDDQGVIVGAKEFTLKGAENKICWYVIHGYASTPDEMREIAKEINLEFDETVVVTRLKGNGEVPSHILNLTLYDWYNQVSEEFDNLNSGCEKINLVGFSFGGALSTKLAENKDVNNVYLLSPYLFARYNWYYILKLETYLDIFTDVFTYGKKIRTGPINSQKGREKYISYRNFPFKPVKDSKPFLEEIKLDLNKITAPVLLQQSKNDEACDIKSSSYIYENIASEKKELIVFEESNHVIQEDYDKEEVIDNILNFEKQTREKKPQYQ